MFVTEDLQQVSRDAQRALEQERDRCVDRIAELDGYLKVLASINDLRMENEHLKEELESMREMYEEEKGLRTKIEMELNETKKLAVGVVNKTSQEALEKALRKFVNKSKQKRIEKRTAVKETVLELIIAYNITLPEDLMQTIESLDDEKPIVLNQNTYNAPVGQVVERADKIVCNE
jgi:ATP-dependent protease HslVU (ClpYQ) ATPase subunit